MPVHTGPVSALPRCALTDGEEDEKCEAILHGTASLYLNELYFSPSTAERTFFDELIFTRSLAVRGR